MQEEANTDESINKLGNWNKNVTIKQYNIKKLSIKQIK